MRQTILVFTTIAVALLILLNLRKLSPLYAEENSELWNVAFAVLFVVLGVVLARYILQKPDSGKDEEEKDPEEACKRLAITPREYEVLKLLANGHSNFEISQALFISESTVKTHVSNLMTKLDAKRRTQVVRKAQELGLL